MERDWKAEAIRQWNADPCGTSEAHPFGSREYFEEVARNRYESYAPWLPGTAGFDRHAGQRILEVGFGLGTDHVSFARGGARCVGIDLTPKHIEATKKLLELNGFPRRLVRGDGERLPFADASFDVVYSFGVLHHTPDTAGAVQEIRRVLRPGGQAIVALYHRDSAFFWYFLLTHGLLKGRIFREGIRGFLSHIEVRHHSDAVPLVKLYSRGRASRLFEGYENVRTTVHHFELSHAGRLSRILGPALTRFKPMLERHLGWYVFIWAEAPAGGGSR
jgi:SAM-dependent methyltransferase